MEGNGKGKGGGRNQVSGNFIHPYIISTLAIFSKVKMKKVACMQHNKHRHLFECIVEHMLSSQYDIKESSTCS